MMKNVDFKEIIDNLHTNKISFEDYENYCKNIKLYSECDEYANFILALHSADVIYTTVEEGEKYCEYLEYLSNLIAEILRKGLTRLNIDLEKSLNTLDNLVEYNMTFDKFSDYFMLFFLARFAKSDKNKCLKWANHLLNIKVILEDAQYKGSYKWMQKFIMEYKLQLEDITKGMEQVCLTRK